MNHVHWGPPLPIKKPKCQSQIDVMFLALACLSSSNAENQAQAADQEQQRTRFGDAVIWKRVQVTQIAVRSNEIDIQNVACLRRKIADRGNRVPVMQPGRAGRLHIQAGRTDGVVYVLSVKTE